MTPNDSFVYLPTANQDAPNPLFNQGGCTQQYFNFQDLLKQATPTGAATFANPCNTAQTIPASVPTFVQTRPLIDWAHGTGPSRTGTFSGSTATTANLGAAGSPVPGPQFGGSASVGGVFYPYADFPAGYQNSYFLGDYTGGWLRNMTVDAANKPTAVRDFIGTGAVVVGMAVNPVNPGLYYVNFPDQIRKVTYNSSNTAPTAVASANKQFGPAPLSVQFTGSASSDSDGQTLSYLWNFGDGTTSPQANPAHVFSPGTSAPTGYTVTLTVTDPLGASNTATLRVSANNTPPQVTITSPVNNALYPLTGPSTYNLRATVTDAEHGASQLSYAWQTFLHHETHTHPEPIDTAPQTTTTLDPLGCAGETYYYRIELTVTDAAGLATKTEVRLNPDCSTAAAYAFYRAVNLAGPALTLDGNAWAGSTAANYTTTGAAFANQAVPLVPATDATRASMIRDAVYGPNLSLSLTAVPAGTYQVYLTVWEDNNAETYSLALNGATVLANASTGPAGTWARLGPYPVTLAATGAVTFNASGRAVNCSGIELWQQTAGPAPANQAPVLAAIGNRAATAGQALTFTASATDPDAGQTLSYGLTGTVPAGAGINATTGAFSWTPTAAGNFALTVRVADNGSPALTDEETVTVTVGTAPSGAFAFYRAVNLAGPALTLDGNAWAGSTAANYTTTGAAFANQAVPLVPATDATRASMIRDAVYGPNLSLSLTAVPAGTYQVYLTVWEDNNAETYSLALNGATVLANASTGPAGTWARLGPYPVTLAAPGALTLSSAGGAVNFSGVELWQQTAGPARAALNDAVLAQASVKGPQAPRPAVFPNPTPDGRFRVALDPEWLGNISYTLYSALGAAVAAGQQARTGTATALELDFHGRMQSSGLYHLRLENAGRQTWVRIVRE